MKKILYIMCAVLLGALASCSQNEPEATDGASTLQPVRINVYTNQANTRATTPDGISRFAIEVYADEAYTTPANVFADGTANKETNATGVFNMILDKSKAYYCLFWADNGDSYTITNLQAVTLATNKIATEAFYGISTITTAVKEQSVTLKRAISKITFTETKSLGIGTLTVKYHEKPEFNVATAKTSGTVTERTTIVNVEAMVTAGATFGDAIYTLADADQKELQDVKFVFQMTGLTAEQEFTVTNVPLQANYTTNIKGHFTSKSAFGFDVTCEEIWGDEDNDVIFPEPTMNIGYFSGEWIEVDNNDNPSPGSGIWRLSKQTVVANKDVSASPMQWATQSTELAINNLTNGKTNTFELYSSAHDDHQYPAAAACFKMNNGYTTIEDIDDARYKWYLPAQNQLMAVWITNNALTTTKTFTALTRGKYYWASTEATYESYGNAWYTSFNYGDTDLAMKNDAGSILIVRCTRDL